MRGIMRVLHVLSSLNIGSGIANFAMNYYRKMPRDSVQFDFLIFGEMPRQFNEEVIKMGGRIYVIPAPTLNVVAYNKKMKRFFKEHAGEWEIVHISEVLIQRFVKRNAKKFGEVKKVIIHSHVTSFVVFGTGFKNRVKGLIKCIRNKILFQGISKADHFVACSREAGIALFGKKIVLQSRFSVIKNAIDLQEYQFDERVRAQYRSDFKVDGRKVIILVGRLSAVKNQLFFLDVFCQLCATDESYTLMLVGDGELKSAISEKVLELGLSDKVIMTGNRSDVRELLWCADLFVLPSSMEGLGIVLIEAQATGLPCITTTNVPLEADVTPYVTRLELNGGSEEWVRACLETKLQRYDTMEFIKGHGYDLDRCVNDLLNLYRSLIACDSYKNIC